MSNTPQTRPVGNLDRQSPFALRKTQTRRVIGMQNLWFIVIRAYMLSKYRQTMRENEWPGSQPPRSSPIHSNRLQHCFTNSEGPLSVHCRWWGSGGWSGCLPPRPTGNRLISAISLLPSEWRGIWLPSEPHSVWAPPLTSTVSLHEINYNTRNFFELHQRQFFEHKVRFRPNEHVSSV